MTQNLLFALMKLLIKPRAKRQLMRIQHEAKVIEPNVAQGETELDSSDEELNLAIEPESEKSHYQSLMKLLANGVVALDS